MNSLKTSLDYLKALGAVFIGGAATALATKYSDPSAIVLTKAGMYHLFCIGLSGGLVTLFAYLKDFKPKA